MNNEITYIVGDETLIDDIEELWDGLNQLHLDKTVDFKSRYRNLTFSERKQSLLSCADGGEMLVVIACDGDEKIGYCVSTVVSGAAEIDSIYVKPGYREKHIGGTLMEKSLAWIDSQKAATVKVKVAVGNEEAFGFYEKYGFKPIFTELQIAKMHTPQP